MDFNFSKCNDSTEPFLYMFVERKGYIIVSKRGTSKARHWDYKPMKTDQTLWENLFLGPGEQCWSDGAFGVGTSGRSTRQVASLTTRGLFLWQANLPVTLLLPMWGCWQRLRKKAIQPRFVRLGWRSNIGPDDRHLLDLSLTRLLF